MALYPMPTPLRWLLLAFLLACLATASSIVTRLNTGLGSWSIFLLFCALPMAFATLKRAGWLEMIISSAALIGLVLLSQSVEEKCQWRVTLTIQHPDGPIVLHDGRGYVAPNTDPKCIPFHHINDAWSIRVADDTPCTASWSNGSAHIEVRSPLKDFFDRRSSERIPNAAINPLSLLFALCGVLLALWTRAMFKQTAQMNAPFITGAVVPLTMLLGVLIASAISSPSAWLSNEFLSRPDDWLCYESGARAMLTGNLFLMPPPGGVELWSLCYTAMIALLHGLLGPAIGALYIVQFATYLLLVPFMVRLVRPEDRSLLLATAIAALVFVGIDIDLHYAWRLLSDVAPLLLLTALFMALQQHRGPKLVALLCGLLYLFRLEFIGMGALVFVFFLLDPTRTSSKERMHFLGIYFLCLLPYFLRWFLFYGNIRPFPIAMEESGHMPMDVMLTSQHIALKFRALFGDYAAINADLRIRYHWFAVHALFLASITYTWIKGLFDRMSLFALACFGYTLATRMLSPSVGIYGHRHSLALVLLEMTFILLVVNASRSRSESVVKA